jgi:hypothetical protein
MQAPHSHLLFSFIIVLFAKCVINVNEEDLHASLITVLFTMQDSHPSQFLYHNLF